MSKFIIFLTYLITFSAFAQDNTTFNKQMERALSHKSDSLKVNDLSVLSQNFKTEWLPDYYLAELSIKNSMSYIYDEATLITKLNKAQGYLDKAYTVENDEAELLIMQAKLYMVYVMSNGEKYGRKYAPIMTNIYNKAKRLAPNNPRVILCKAQWEMGMAKYFGSSTESFCKSFEKAVNLFDTFKVKSTIHPNWGLLEAEKAVKSCNK